MTKFVKVVLLLITIGLLAGMPTVSWGQSPGESFTRSPAHDIDDLTLNASPRGIWSDETTMWVTDQVDAKIYAYNMATMSRDAGKEFNTLHAAGNRAPGGIWSDRMTMWVADQTDGKIYAYSMATKARDAGKDFDNLNAVVNLSSLGGLWSDGTTMWVADVGAEKIHAFDLSTKHRDSAKEFGSLGIETTTPFGIWSDETTMWVADYFTDKIYAYNLDTKQRDSDKDFGTLIAAGNLSPSGIWSDEETLWVADPSKDKIYAYNLASKQRDIGMDFGTLDPIGNSTPRGIWSDGTTMWVGNASDKKIYAYNLGSKLRDPGNDIFFHGNHPVGIWSDGMTMWVAEGSYLDEKIYAYSMATKARDAGKEFNTLRAAGNRSPTGIWSNGTTVWVAEDHTQAAGQDKIYAYSMETKVRDAGKDFDTLDDAGNDAPLGIWSDGTTMWVADYDDSKIYAYSMATKARDAGKDFDTLDGAGNDAPQGIWSNGTTMWVADINDQKIYAYSRPGGATTTRPSDDTEEPEPPPPPPPSAVKAHCIANTAADSEAGRIELGGVIKDRWIGGCPSVTGGGRLAKYYTFSIPHTATVEIALGSHFDDLLVLRRGDLGGTLVARDDDSGPGNDSRIYTTLLAGDYTVEATTFYVQGVEGDFTLSAYASDRILYSGYPGFASGEEISANLQGATYLDIRILPTLPLPTMQIWISDRDGFGPGQPGAAEKLLQGRIESDAGSPGSVMLAVPNGVWVDHGGITVETATSVGGEWKTHTAADEQKLLDGDGGIFGFLRKIASAATSLIGGSNPLETLAGWLQLMTGGQTMVEGETAAMLGLGESALSPIFQASYANCYSQISVPWLVEEKDVKEIVISIPVILTDSEYVSVGAEFIARESGENEQSLVQAHDLLSTGQSLPACQRP